MSARSEKIRSERSRSGPVFARGGAGGRGGAGLRGDGRAAGKVDVGGGHDLFGQLGLLRLGALEQDVRHSERHVDEQGVRECDDNDRNGPEQPPETEANMEQRDDGSDAFEDPV